MRVLDQFISAETHESTEELVGPLVKFNPQIVGTRQNLLSIKGIQSCLSMLFICEIDICGARHGVDALKPHVGLWLLHFHTCNGSILGE